MAFLAEGESGFGGWSWAVRPGSMGQESDAYQRHRTVCVQNDGLSRLQPLKQDGKCRGGFVKQTAMVVILTGWWQDFAGGR